MTRIKLICTHGFEFELFRDDDGDYHLLQAGSSTYHGPLTTEAAAEDEADFLALTGGVRPREAWESRHPKAI